MFQEKEKELFYVENSKQTYILSKLKAYMKKIQ